MTRTEDIGRLITGAHALTRMAALRTGSETPAAQWRTLILLRDHGALRMGDLATLSRVSQPGMTRLVRQMEEHGLVERGDDPSDSRATIVTATPAGFDALASWRAQLDAALEPFFSDLTEQEWTALQMTAAILDRKTTMAEAVR